VQLTRLKHRRGHPELGRDLFLLRSPDDPANRGPLDGPAARCLPHSAAHGGSLDAAAHGGSLDAAAHHRPADTAASHGLPDTAAGHGPPDNGPANPGAPPGAAACGSPDDPAKAPASHGLSNSAAGHSPLRDAPCSAYPAHGPPHPPPRDPLSHRHRWSPCYGFRADEPGGREPPFQGNFGACPSGGARVLGRLRTGLSGRSRAASPIRSSIVGNARGSTISPVVGALQIGGVGVATSSPSIYIQTSASNRDFTHRRFSRWRVQRPPCAVHLAQFGAMEAKRRAERRPERRSCAPTRRTTDPARSAPADAPA
jgi:hypothetical protein